MFSLERLIKKKIWVKNIWVEKISLPKIVGSKTILVRLIKVLAELLAALYNGIFPVRPGAKTPVLA